MKRLTVSAQTCVEILGTLAAMAWADGRLDDTEKEGMRAAARVLNLPKEERDRLEQLLASPPPVDQILFERLSLPIDRAFAYVAAAWMAGADSDLAEKEKGLLERIAAQLHLPEGRAEQLRDLAKDLSHPEAKDRSDELVRLFKSIPPRLLEDPEDDLEVVFE